MKNFKNNKGFSLVELIIVVAIMAILIGILAPTYLKYVENSRLSADNDTIDSIRKACETALTDPDSKISSGFTINFSTTGGAQVASGGDSNAAAEVGAIATLGTDKTKLKSKTYAQANPKPSVVVTFTGGVPKVEVSNVVEKTTSSASVGTTGTPTDTPTDTP